MCLIGAAGNLIDVVGGVGKQPNHLADAGQIKVYDLPLGCHFEHIRLYALDAGLLHPALDCRAFFFGGAKGNIQAPASFGRLIFCFVIRDKHPLKKIGRGKVLYTLPRRCVKYPVPPIF